MWTPLCVVDCPIAVAEIYRLPRCGPLQPAVLIDLHGGDIMLDSFVCGASSCRMALFYR
jgi:hypothetical protein